MLTGVIQSARGSRAVSENSSEEREIELWYGEAAILVEEDARGREYGQV
jgi:ferric-dicitrate binding protein FerR (iron transport regulator)